MATTLNNLAELYNGEGRHARAETFHWRSLAILEKAHETAQTSGVRSELRIGAPYELPLVVALRRVYCCIGLLQMGSVS